MPFPALLALIGPAVKGISKAVKGIKAAKAVKAAIKAGKAVGSVLKQHKPTTSDDGDPNATTLREVVVSAPAPHHNAGQMDLLRQLGGTNTGRGAGVSGALPKWAIPAGLGAGFLLLLAVASNRE